jgi:peptidoglycan/LPS O-acetylase OafA/YrhL
VKGWQSDADYFGYLGADPWCNIQSAQAPGNTRDGRADFGVSSSPQLLGSTLISNSQTNPTSGRSQVLDALRAIAILLVLGRHTNVAELWTRGGWCGVDLFFVLSGFLISGLLFQEYKRFGDIRLKTFWLRRGLKIYPAYYVYTFAVAATYMFVFRNVPGVQFPLRQLLVDATFLSSYFQGLSSQAWSLAIEEHFYFFLPVLLLVLMNARGKKKDDPFRSIPVIFVAVAVGSLLLRMMAKPANPRDYFSYLFPTHLRMDGLLCGVMLGYFFHFKPQLLARVSRWPMLIAGAALLSPIYFFEVENWNMHSWGLTSAYLGFACILLWAIHQRAPKTRLFAWPIATLARIGFYSYSIYLWHWLVIYYLRAYVRYQCVTFGSPFEWSDVMETWQWPACVVLSIVVGVATSMVIEQPALRLRDRWFPSRTRVPAAGPEAALNPSSADQSALAASASSQN